MTKKLLLSVLMFLPLMASAKIYFDNTYVDGFYYKFNESDKTASVSCASYQNDNYYGEDARDLPGDWYNIKSYYSGSIVIPSEVTYNEVPYKVTTIDYYAFYKCSNLTSITIPSSVTDICSNAFYGCSGLTSIVVENGNPKYDSRNNCNAIIYSESNMLILGCRNTIIPDGVTSIGYAAFQGCSDLKSVTIPPIVASIGSYAFQNCSGLTSVTIPESVTTIGNGAFNGCYGLTSINIPTKLTSIEPNTFQNCSGLTSVTIGAYVTKIGYQAFSGCSKLTDLYCEALNAPTATYAFKDFNTTNVTLHVPASSLDIYSQTEPWSKFKEFVPLADDGQQVEICATPTITFEKGDFVFNCETEGVTFCYEISQNSSGSSTGNSSGSAERVKAYTPNSVTVSVYAKKAGYFNSKTVTATFTGKFGDLNGDGEVNVADHVELSNIIMEQ